MFLFIMIHFYVIPVKCGLIVYKILVVEGGGVVFQAYGVSKSFTH